MEDKQHLVVCQIVLVPFMLVDHNLWGLQFHCKRALLLHNGSLFEFDDLDEAISSHKRLLELPNHVAQEVLAT